MNVSWNEAVEFCRKLSGMTRRTVRLPTEAEWEYACRAGTASEWFFGDPDKLAALGEYAWYTGRPAWKMPREVGGKKPNPWGLYDMYGNVAEWCRDRFAPDYYAWSPVDDPAGPSAGIFRVIRGGSAYNLIFAANPELARSARRGYAHPDVRGPGQPGSCSEIGFRVVVEADASKPRLSWSVPISNSRVRSYCIPRPAHLINTAPRCAPLRTWPGRSPSESCPARHASARNNSRRRAS